MEDDHLGGGGGDEVSVGGRMQVEKMMGKFEENLVMIVMLMSVVMNLLQMRVVLKMMTCPSTVTKNLRIIESTTGQCSV